MLFWLYPQSGNSFPGWSSVEQDIELHIDNWSDLPLGLKVWCCTGDLINETERQPMGIRCMLLCSRSYHYTYWMSTNGNGGACYCTGDSDHWDWMSTNGDLGISYCTGSHHWDWTPTNGDWGTCYYSGDLAATVMDGWSVFLSHWRHTFLHVSAFPLKCLFILLCVECDNIALMCDSMHVLWLDS